MPEHGDRAGARQYLGLELRHARVAASLTQKEVAEGTQYGPSYVGMVETGARLPSEYYVQTCDKLFETNGYLSRLFSLLKTRGQNPDWFIPYLQLEAAATEIFDHSASLVMGLLQTPAYTHELVRIACPTESEEFVQERVDARMQRRDVLRQENPPLLWVVLDESCLRRVVGSTAVLREQLQHLLVEAQKPHITLQVLPHSNGPLQRVESYTLLKFPQGSAILYAETPDGGHVIDTDATTTEAASWAERARAESLPPAASLDMIRRYLEEQ